MTDDNLREQLAAIEHERWADWQRWLHSKCRKITEFGGEGGLMIPQGYVDHLERQIKTPYSELSDQEKASDIEQVDRYWPLLLEVFQAREKRLEASNISMLARAVGMLEGLGYPDKLLVDYLDKKLKSQSGGEEK